MSTQTSVIIPVRNGAALIGDAIASVLGQLGQGDELIVVDDNSSDDTLSVVAAVGDGRVRVLSTGGRGAAAARNAGLAAARGELIAFLDHDDLWPEGRHGTMLQILSERPEVDAVYGRIRVRIDPGGTLPSAQYVELDGQSPIDFFVCNSLYRRRIVDRAGRFAEDMPLGEDIDFNLRLIEAGMKVALCHADGLIHRRHPSNGTNDKVALRNSLFDVLRRKLARKRQPSMAEK